MWGEIFFAMLMGSPVSRVHLLMWEEALNAKGIHSKVWMDSLRDRYVFDALTTKTWAWFDSSHA